MYKWFVSSIKDKRWLDMNKDGLLYLGDSIRNIKGIGEKSEKDFAKLGVHSVENLVTHYPRNYDAYLPPIYMSELEEGKVCAIEASVISNTTMKQVKHLKIITVTVKDRSGSMMLSWFNMPFLKNKLYMGYHFIFRGKVARKNGVLSIEQAAIYTRDEYFKLMNILQPIYPLTAGISNNLISKSVKYAMTYMEPITEYIPKRIIKEHGLMSYKHALAEIHFPKSKDVLMDARKRLVFDEFFQFSLALLALKDKKTVITNTFEVKEKVECNQFIEKLPFPLTNAQVRVWSEIKQDLASNKSMNRLVQGDVGSGKTILAGMALFLMALNGYQGCLMVPTEVLAVQHFESLTKSFEAFGIKTILLVGSMTAANKRKAYEKIKRKEVDIVIGTHALIQEKVEYNNLGLVVTDEQHRFGVRQRETLMSKGQSPHVLVMSATPIPRTLAIILYGDLDISIVDELPANRLPIKNCVVDTGYRSTAYHFIEKEVREGRQAYVICAMVEESENMEAENVIEYTEKLKEAMSPSVQVEFLHGKMKGKEKNEIMERFQRREIHVLVSTTVIEVGVNVPNSTVMMIENAERFGLAQLHQLRGRVGRGQHQSYCILVSGMQGKEVRERLEILNKSNDGFYIAEEDLKLRGPGDMFGIRQSGAMEFKIGDVYNDSNVLMDANKAVKSLTEEEIAKIMEEHQTLYDKILNFELATL